MSFQIKLCCCFIITLTTRDCIQARLNTLVGWGLQMFMKVLGLVSYMEKMISDPSEPTFVIRVCQICKIPKLWKNHDFLTISPIWKTYIRWKYVPKHPWPVQQLWQKNFPKNYSQFSENGHFLFLKNPFFKFHEILGEDT